MSFFLDKYYSITRKPLDHPLGYTVAISGALMKLICYGLENSFSMYAMSMSSDPTLENSKGGMSLKFGNSVVFGISPVFGVLAGFLVDRLPPRVMILTSTFFLFIGLWIGSTVKSVVGVIFTFCLFASIASAFMISPSATMTGTWFKNRLSIAQGINSCGGGLGNIVIQPISGYLLDHYNWRTSFRLISIVCLIGLFASIFSCNRGEPFEDSKEKESDAVAKGDGNSKERNAKSLPSDSGKGLSNASVQLRAVSYEVQAEHKFVGRSESNHCPLAAGESSIPLTNSNSTGGMSEQHTIIQPSMEVNDSDTSISDYERLIHAMHTRRLSIVETLRIFLTVKFLANFFMYFFFAWTFFGLLTQCSGYFGSMGKKGTPYADAEAISYTQIGSLFTYWGVFQIISCICVGTIGDVASEPFAYILCCFIGAVMCILIAFFRTYALFALGMSVLGFATAGIFTLMLTFIVKDFYGPSTGLIMSTIFLGGCVGGFCSPIALSHIYVAANSHTPGFIFMGCCTIISGILCFLFLSPNKKCRMPFCSM